MRKYSINKFSAALIILLSVSTLMGFAALLFTLDLRASVLRDNRKMQNDIHNLQKRLNANLDLSLEDHANSEKTIKEYILQAEQNEEKLRELFLEHNLSYQSLNKFELYEMESGDTIGPWGVVSIERTDLYGDYTAVLKGDVTVSGAYETTDFDGMMPGVILFRPDAKSCKLLPGNGYSETECQVIFSIGTEERDGKIFPGDGRATIRLSAYQVNSLSTEILDWATISQVISVTADTSGIDLSGIIKSGLNSKSTPLARGAFAGSP